MRTLPQTSLATSPVGGRMAGALAMVFGAYVATLLFLTLRFATSHDDDILAVALAFLSVAVARNAAASGFAARILNACRRMPGFGQAMTGVAMVLLAIVVDYFLDGDPEHFRPVSFIWPIVVTAIVFGARSSLCTIAASSLSVSYFVLDPKFSLQIASASDALDLMVFVIASAQMVHAIGRLSGADAASLEQPA